MCNFNISSTCHSEIICLYSGVGFAIAQRLLEEAQLEDRLSDLCVCLACRNLQKAKFAKQQLHGQFGSDIVVDLLELDVSRPASVNRAAEEISRRLLDQVNIRLQPVIHPQQPLILKRIYAH